MIIKGNKRGHGKELANHLMNARDNEHVELFDLRGFVADDLHGAMQETEAIARGTRAEKPFFSLSLNPPDQENVPPDVFETALGRIEDRLGLNDQPRALVFHEKEGRRHMHAVYSRIDGEEMKAVRLDYYKRHLNDVAREMYLEHGWEMPRGFKERAARDPLSFTLSEWQQAKRTGQDPKAMKEAMREAWKGSDTRQAFEAALRERGYMLAQGDRRGFVSVDWRGEVYSLSRTTGAKTKELQARLGDPQKLQAVDDAKGFIAERMTPKLKTWAREAEALADKQNLAAQFQRDQMVQRQRHLRDQLKRQQEQRWLQEEQQRAERTPTGVRGLWGWITGKNRKIREENEAEIARTQERDRTEKQAIIERQLEERRKLQEQMREAREKQQEHMQALNRDVAHYMMLGGKAPIEVTQRFEDQNRDARLSEERLRRSREEQQERQRQQDQQRQRDRGLDHEPS